MRARFGDYTLGTVCVAAINTRIRILVVQPAGVLEKAVEASAASTGGEARLRRGIVTGPTVLQVKDADLRVSCTCDYCSITRVGHEFDAEDIGLMASTDTGIESEWLRQVARIVVPDVEIGVIRT